jgi:hypothetical protein
MVADLTYPATAYIPCGSQASMAANPRGICALAGQVIRPMRGCWRATAFTTMLAGCFWDVAGMLVGWSLANQS